MSMRNWATRAVNWPPARNAIKGGVHAYARGRGVALNASGRVPEVANIFTASSPKGGSQFMKELFSHPTVAAHHRLLTLPQRLYQDYLTQAVPLGTYVPGVHMTWDEFQRWPHPAPWKVVYMFRDPRELLVSGYYSGVGVHRPMPGDVEEFRVKLRSMPRSEGLMANIAYGGHRIAEMATWVDVEHPDVFKLRLEDVAAEPTKYIPAMLEHCGINLNDEEMARVLADVSRESMQARDLALRDEGSESHYRKERTGYREVFEPKHYAAAEALAPGLVGRLGYPED